MEFKPYNYYILINQQSIDHDSSELIRQILVHCCKEGGIEPLPDDIKVLRIKPPVQGLMEISFKQRNTKQYSVIKNLTEYCGRLILNENSGEWYLWTGDSDAVLLDYHLEVITMKLRQLNGEG